MNRGLKYEILQIFLETPPKLSVLADPRTKKQYSRYTSPKQLFVMNSHMEHCYVEKDQFSKRGSHLAIASL
jgi:hypothetical protein